MKKLFMVLILIMTMLANTLTVAAAERPTLTVDRAVQRAIGNSTQIIELAEGVILEEIRGRDIRQRFLMPSIDLLGIAIDQMVHEIAMAFQHSDRAMQVASITQSVQTGFLAIINAETELEFLDRRIDIDRQNFRFDQIRYEHGLMSVNDFNEARQSLQALERQREDLETQINRVHRSLVNLVGGRRGTHYNVEIELEFVPLGNSRTLDDYIAVTLAQNAGLRREQRSLGVSEYRFEAQGSHSDDDRTRREIELGQEQRRVQTTRDSLTESVISLYDDIRALERRLTSLRTDYENLRTQLAINEAMLDMERMTRLAFDEFILSMDRARNDIRIAEADHSIMVQRLRNPNLN
ncbi:MAG: TolC family protein [Defluviitaleaceae bacterium]|nr:TolC family protein [Defluviitaleaceae bacterium]